MNNRKLLSYYNKLNNPKYTIGDWAITNDTLYNRIKGKLNITAIMGGHTETSTALLNSSKNIICETKNKYIAFKFNNCFLCLRESDTEYGLVGEYELLAVNTKNIKQQATNVDVCIDKLFKLFEIKLSKKAKETLKYLESL